ncbi:GntR family transcriptional regulator [Parasphingorhabdus pacifica]
MLLTLDLNDPRPLHEQVADVVRRAITTGEVAPGERLPSARDLAAALDVNANTVLRALRELRDEQLLEFRRGRGITVLRRPDVGAQLREKVQDLVDEARQHGFRAQDLVEWIKESR